MADRFRGSKSVWLLPIVVLIAALMVLPAGSLLASHRAAPTGVSTGATAATAGAGLHDPFASAFAGRVPSILPSPTANLLPHLESNLGSSLAGPSPFVATLPGTLPTPFSASGPTTTLSSRLAQVNATFAHLPGATAEANVARLIAEGVVPARDAYLPNLALLSRPAGSVVAPTYNVSPAPMGIADLGLGAGGPYARYASDVLGNVSLNGYNATAGTLYQDTGAYYWDGLSPNAEVTPWQSGVQLNTVVTNVSFPGSNTGNFWTQNVVDFSGNSLQFIDNVWNFSAPGAGLNAGTLYSYNGTLVAGALYYAFGPTLPVSFPMTLQLYNNASNVGGRTTVTFGYRVTEGLTVFTGIYDTVVFNSKPTGGTPLLTPDYLIDGYAPNPGGLLYDAELVFGGPGGGSNAVVNAVNGTMSLAYNLAGGWSPAPSAYDYGADTGETAIGMNGVWSGTTETINQGPSMLYGLWNTPSGVPHGAAEIQFHASPSYALTFFGSYGTSNWNLSYAPADAAGIATVWLPPSANGYNVTVFADSFDQVSGTIPSSFTQAGDVSSWTNTATLNPGSWNAPVYLNGPAQALSFFTNATGWTSGPYVLSGATLDVNLTFNHLNDWGFAEFDLFWADNVGNNLTLNNVNQGGNTFGSVCADTSPLQPWSCYLSEFPYGYFDLPYYGSQIVDWQGQDALFENLVLHGGFIPALGLSVAGALSLWSVQTATVEDLLSLNNSYGVWAASSPGLSVYSGTSYNAVVATLSDSPNAFAQYTVTVGGAGILDIGSPNAFVVDTMVEDLGVGFEGLAANNSAVFFLDAAFSTGVELQSSSGDAAGYFTVVNGGIGVVGQGLNFTEFGYFQLNASLGVEMIASVHTLGFDLYATNGSIGAVYLGSLFSDTFYAVSTTGSLGVLLQETGFSNVTNVAANDSLGAVDQLGFFGPVNITDVNATAGATGVLSLDSTDLSVRNVSAYSPLFPRVSTGVVLNDTWSSTVTNVTSVGVASGVNITSGSALDWVSHVNASDGALGILSENLSGELNLYDVNASGPGTAGIVLSDSLLINAWNISASTGAVGLVAEVSEEIYLQHVSAIGFGSLGVLALNVQVFYLWGTNASFGAAGAEIEFASWVWGTYTNATNGSVGALEIYSNDSWFNNTYAANGSNGLGFALDWGVHADGIVAVSPNPGGMWSGPLIGTPVAGVVLYGTNQSSVSGLTTTDYPVGLYDNASFDLTVQGVNASYGIDGLMLNGTTDSLFTDISTYADHVGALVGPAKPFGSPPIQAAFDVFTQSSFVDNSGYGIEFLGGTYRNLVYDNSFIGNNGANSTYQASHIQAFSANPSNAFNNSAEIGNYWADWHTYLNGVLAPYYTSNGAWDYHPLGAPEGTFQVTFVANGLAPGTLWSVTLGGVTRSTVGGTIVFDELPGTYAFSVGGLAGWSVSPSSGAVVLTTAAMSVAVDFSALYSVSFAESGLPASTAWSVVLGGVLITGTSSTLVGSVVAGTYGYSVLAPSGYTASPGAGSVTVAADYYVPVSFSLTGGPTYTVTIDESGLVSGTSWSAVFNGVSESTTGTSLSFTVQAGSYAYQVGNVGGYSVSPSSGTASISGNYVIDVSYTSTSPSMATVHVVESGLPGGTSWSAYLDGVLATGTGTTLSYTVPANGSYSYQVSPVSGYRASPSSGSVSVGSGPYTVSVTFTAVTYAVTFAESGLTPGTSWSIVVNGQTYTSTGTSVSVDLANGTAVSYTYQAVSGYSLTGASGSFSVHGAATGASATYGPTSSPSYVPQSMFNMDWAIVLGVAVLGVLLALVSLLRKPKAAPPTPPASWQEPPPSSGSGGAKP